MWQNTKTTHVTKLGMWQSWECDKNLKFENSKHKMWLKKNRNPKWDKIQKFKCDKTQNVTKLKKLKMWQNSKTKNLTKIKN